MKKLMVCLLLFIGLVSKAQVYNNEWIDYSKTYYKFKVGKTGLHRLPQSILATAGLGSTPVEYFQLWRNGAQVPIYTSVASGSLPSSGYIEFWGEMNDGKPDKELYKEPDYQLNDKWSLQTDTASYFLTVNSIVASNLRLQPTPNNVAGNTLPAEAYFMHTEGVYFREFWNNGYAVNVGSYLLSSVYDRGEGLSSSKIDAGSVRTSTLSNLNIYGAGPAAKFRIALSGTQVNPRRYQVKINGDSILGKQMDYFNYSKDSTTNLPITLLSSNNAIIEVANISPARGDNMSIHQFELTYPRQFSFGGQSNFEFNLPASAVGNYLEIKNFAYGSTQPVLYDLTNGKRYVADITTPSTVKVVLGPSVVSRRLVLVNAESSNIITIAQPLLQRDFIDYSQINNQGNYIIITNSVLIPSSGSNPIEEYRQYHNSAIGGGYTTIVALIDQLVDQFAFGIKKHPMSIRNFLLYARHHFTMAPKNVFLIGRSVTYQEQRNNESNSNIEKINLVPTFGVPASDMLLTANKGDSYPQIPIGRLSVISAEEVAVYLRKVKEYEEAQRTPSPFIKEKFWMKNVVHAVGSSEPTLQRILDYYMGEYAKTISDSLFGGKVYTFTKTSPESIQQINSGGLTKLFEEGISLITYFGHSSTTSLEFNLNNPENYNNKGKYPLFIALGCNAGNYYNFDQGRLISAQSLSEKFVLAPERGTIGFIASSHFGIVHYLDIYNSRLYKSLAYSNYGKTIGENMQYAIAQMFAYTTQDDFYSRAQCEETSLHGDPAIVLNSHIKPDYVVEEEQARIEPGFISVVDTAFKFKVRFANIGRAIDKKLVVEIKREFPDKTIGTIYRSERKSLKYDDFIELTIPVDPIKDKGSNKLIVTIDPENDIEELYETNNSITKEFVIYSEEARPVYPYNFSIINKQGIKFVASTANPFSASKKYYFEVDTLESFNSPALLKQEQISKGGVIEFIPQLTFKENAVYYWRVAPELASGSLKWNTASFIYLPNSEEGYNQSQIGQHKSSGKDRVLLSETGTKWRFDSIYHSLTIKNGVLVTATGQESDLSISVDGDPYIRNSCDRNVLLFNIFDPKSFKPVPNPSAAYGSNINCRAPGLWNFEYSHMNATARNKARDFMDAIPDGYFVVVRNIMRISADGGYAENWKNDDPSGNTLYNKLKSVGFSDIDAFNKPTAFAFIYQKNNNGFIPVSHFSTTDRDILKFDHVFKVPDSTGSITSPLFGPAKEWKQLLWEGASLENPSTDGVLVDVIGIRKDGTTSVEISNISPSQMNVDISMINAEKYPNIQLRLNTKDKVNYNPYQLQYWRVTGKPLPEGAIAPNIFLQMKDTFDIGEPVNFKVAFKNVSETNFPDSIEVKAIITDNNNIEHIISTTKQKPLNFNDTTTVSVNIPTSNLKGANLLFVEVNPDNKPLEKYRYNNFLFYNFYVKGDTLRPIIDVTFDNTHILNGDIVAAKPAIQIKLKDDARWLTLDDEKLVTVKVKFPDQQVREYNYTSDTLRFSPAQKAPNGDNTATIDFKPYFTQDGDYELIVAGKDKSENIAGDLEYRVKFQVINKPMISNMLNYPNPFTTSTAFVFTITGTEVPQNLKIQILTISGKVVKEITKQELGNLHVGRNITDYKWDGTDQYGQKLGNGVYLYRVVTNLNGKSLGKYKAADDTTDKYFNNGYGKMYLMR